MRRIVVLVLALTFALHTASTFAFAAVAAAQGTATLSGTARSSSGQPIRDCSVQLRDVLTGQLVGTTSCNREGAFMFTGLNPGNYVVEVVNTQGVVIGTSAVSAVAAGATVTMTVTAATAVAVTEGGGISTAVILTALAAAAGVVAVVVVNRGQASPSQ
jgi:carboxypeptidase family protein